MFYTTTYIYNINVPSKQHGRAHKKITPRTKFDMLHTQKKNIATFIFQCPYVNLRLGMAKVKYDSTT